MAPATTLSENASHPYSRLLWSAANAHTGRRTAESSGWELSEQERPKEGCRFRARCAVYREMGEPSICREKDSEPELREIGPSHRVRCYFPERESIEASPAGSLSEVGAWQFGPSGVTWYEAHGIGRRDMKQSHPTDSLQSDGHVEGDFIESLYCEAVNDHSASSLIDYYRGRES